MIEIDDDATDDEVEPLKSTEIKMMPHLRKNKEQKVEQKVEQQEEQQEEQQVEQQVEQQGKQQGKQQVEQEEEQEEEQQESQQESQQEEQQAIDPMKLDETKEEDEDEDEDFDMNMPSLDLQKTVIHSKSSYEQGMYLIICVNVWIKLTLIFTKFVCNICSMYVFK